MFKKIDCVRITVSDLEEALKFYNGSLGMELVWRLGSEQAGLRIGKTESELVLVKESLEHPEVDFSVDSVSAFVESFKKIGGKVVVEPFEINIGMCTVVEDLWSNRFVVLDNSKGNYRVDSEKNVI